MNVAGTDHLNSARARKKRQANYLTLGRDLTGNPATCNLVVFDEFSRQIILQKPIPRNGAEPKFMPRPWTDDDTAALAEHFNERGFGRCGTALVYSVAQFLEASRHPVHPLRDYLDSLVNGRQQPLLGFCRSAGDADRRGDRRRVRCWPPPTSRRFRAASSSARWRASSSQAARSTPC